MSKFYMSKTKEEELDEIERIFIEAKEALYILHDQKLKLINKFKSAADAEEAADILNKLKALR